MDTPKIRHAYDLYFPVFTIEYRRDDDTSRRVFEPKGNYEFLSLASDKKGLFFPLFTDDDFAQRGIEYYENKGVNKYRMIEIKFPQQLVMILEKFKQHGVKYVGTDITFSGADKITGIYISIDHAIQSARNFKFIPFKDNDLGTVP